MARPPRKRPPHTVVDSLYENPIPGISWACRSAFAPVRTPKLDSEDVRRCRLAHGGCCERFGGHFRRHTSEPKRTLRGRTTASRRNPDSVAVSIDFSAAVSRIETENGVGYPSAH